MLEAFSIKQMIIISLVNGALAAYLAHRWKKNPWVGFILGSMLGLFGIFFLFFASKKKVEETAPAPSPFATLEPLGWHFLNDDRETIGPMSATRLEEHYKENKLSPESLVWHESLTEWKPLSAVLETVKE